MKVRRPKQMIFSIWPVLIVWMLTTTTLYAECFLPHGRQKVPENVPKEYRGCFVHYADDNRSLIEKALNHVRLTGKEIGRSFALLAGVSSYPNIPETLEPAKVDIEKLVDYLKTQEFFEEIVVLLNEDFTEKNLRYFLQSYFPKRVGTPKSRFLFAFSGHGITDNNKGYLLESTARSFKDKENAISLNSIRDLFTEVVGDGKAHHTLALINSCYGGAFLPRPFGPSSSYRPQWPGAHAITAGRNDERVYHHSESGPGSVFFEKFFAALDQRADTFPAGGDGIITFHELSSWLALEMRRASNEGYPRKAGQWGVGHVR